MRILYWFLIVVMVSVLLVEVVSGDVWRSFWLAVSLACFLAVRRELLGPSRG
jgi:hypothetical protein